MLIKVLINEPKTGLAKWYNDLCGNSVVITLFLKHLWTCTVVTLAQ